MPRGFLDGRGADSRSAINSAVGVVSTSISSGSGWPRARAA
jgi:hypothetical protein